MPIGQWSFKSYLQASQENLDVPDNRTWIFLSPANLDVKKTLSIPSPTKILLILNGWKGCLKAVNCLITKQQKKKWKLIYFVNRKCKRKIRAFWSPNLLRTLVGNFTTTNIHHGQKSRTSNFVWLTIMLSRNGQSRWFLWWILGS